MNLLAMRYAVAKALESAGNDEIKAVEMVNPEGESGFRLKVVTSDRVWFIDFTEES